MEKYVKLSVGDFISLNDEILLGGTWYHIHKINSNAKTVSLYETCRRKIVLDDSQYRFLDDNETIQEEDEYYSVSTMNWRPACSSIGHQVKSVFGEFTVWRRKITQVILTQVYTPKPTLWTDGEDGWIYYDSRPAFLVNASLNVDLQEVVNALNGKGVIE
jgi:hypothetical protein